MVQARDRQMYHLRHTRDYEALGVPIGSDKATIKKAYRNLAKVPPSPLPIHLGSHCAAVHHPAWPRDFQNLGKLLWCSFCAVVVSSRAWH